MIDSSHPLDVIASPQPELADAVVLEILESEYGLGGSLTPLVSERDQNFRLACPDGKELVVKIANAAEPTQITEFQIEVLRHLEQVACSVPVPRVIPTLTGNHSCFWSGADTQHLVRVVSYLPGVPVDTFPVDEHLGFELGRSLASLDSALQGFSHPGESQVLLWDMQRAAELSDIVDHVSKPELQAQLRECLDSFSAWVLPEFASFRKQVIHNDMNPDNVLVSEDGSGVVTGIIDFGDMLRAPLVADVAIAASYLRTDDLVALRGFVSGFESVTPLTTGERGLLYELVRVRLAATIIILHWRAQARHADDPYLTKVSSEQSAEQFFGHLTGLGKARFDALISGY